MNCYEEEVLFVRMEYDNTHQRSGHVDVLLNSGCRVVNISLRRNGLLLHRYHGIGRTHDEFIVLLDSPEHIVVRRYGVEGFLQCSHVYPLLAVEHQRLQIVRVVGQIEVTEICANRTVAHLSCP